MSSEFSIFYCRDCIRNNIDKLEKQYGVSRSMLSVNSNEPQYYAGILHEIDIETCPGCGKKLIKNNKMSSADVFNFCKYGNYNAEFIIKMFDLYNNDIISYMENMNKIKLIMKERSRQSIEDDKPAKPQQSQVQSTNHTSITQTEQVCCPKCGSTQITAGRRGFSVITGFFGANKVVNRCANCGYSWKPNR